MPPTAIVRDENAIRSQKGLYIFGRDIREVPCMRSSLLVGVLCGPFAGLISFMFTSKAVMSCHIGFGSLWVAVFAYWIPCRYQHEAKKSYTAGLTSAELYARAATRRDTPINPPEENEKV